MESRLESVYSACLKPHAEGPQDKVSVPLIEIDDDGSDEAGSDVEIIGVRQLELIIAVCCTGDCILVILSRFR